MTRGTVSCICAHCFLCQATAPPWASNARRRGRRAATRARSRATRNATRRSHRRTRSASATEVPPHVALPMMLLALWHHPPPTLALWLRVLPCVLTYVRAGCTPSCFDMWQLRTSATNPSGPTKITASSAAIARSAQCTTRWVKDPRMPLCLHAVVTDSLFLASRIAAARAVCRSS